MLLKQLPSGVVAGPAKRGIVVSGGLTQGGETEDSTASTRSSPTPCQFYLGRLYVVIGCMAESDGEQVDNAGKVGSDDAVKGYFIGKRGGLARR